MMVIHNLRCIASPVNLRVLLCFFFLVLLVFPATGYPGQWRVTPARVFLERGAKSSVITMVNEGEEKVHLQGKAVVWTQGPDGKDVYQETNDLVFFPRILTIAKGEQKIIRTGLKIPATAIEKTYRLFIEEIPQPKQNTTDSAQLTVALRFGVPVFARPNNEEPGGEVVSSTLSKGALVATVKNTGNVHFRISDIVVKGRNGKGDETFTAKLDGWYLLAGAVRNYTTQIPPEKCAVTEQLDISISTDSKLILNRQLNVEKAQCLP